jgi:hypothetical protein
LQLARKVFNFGKLSKFCASPGGITGTRDGIRFWRAAA